MKKYCVGFRNGMVITIDADSLRAAGYNDIEFITGDRTDTERYVRATDVLFAAPVENVYVERGAVAPIAEK